jgi:RNA polymerase sigma factor (sigma-70 family)
MQIIEEYWPLIRRVAREVARQSNVRYGYAIVSPEDLAQDVYIQLVKSGVDFDDLDSPQAWVRRTAQHKAFDTINRTLGRPRGGGGLVEPLTEEHGRTRSTRVGRPEEELEHSESLQECRAVIDRILISVWDLDQRRALEDFYLRGRELSAADRQRKGRAEKRLAPEDLASLQVWRAWLFPELRNRTPKTEATPLLAVLL